MALHVPGYLSPSRSDSYYSEVHYSSVRSQQRLKDVLSQHSWITQLCECFSVFLCECTCIPACIFMTCYLIRAPHIPASVCMCVNGGSVVRIMLFIVVQNSLSFEEPYLKLLPTLIEIIVSSVGTWLCLQQFVTWLLGYSKNIWIFKIESVY